ncbi:UNVERIFIED_CONTAM: protein TOPLESS [Sesamum angustifolium]|uniref:Protein TOPLESS n=1 Tax=Sesamum angustifolium TaxID=2727405 RepID=A0AAW2LLL3_9LAMI
MSSLSRELVFLILQFLDEEKFKETVHKLEKESGFFFNMRYFEDSVTNGEWEEVEKYLSGFTKVDDNRYSMKIFFEIRKQKYLEALDKENDQLSKYGDTKSARAIMLVELKKLIEANPLFRDKLQFPTLKNSRLRTLINQSLNWQHQLCKNPKPNPDIKTLFVDHSCGQSNGARAPSPVTNPLMGSIPKVGGFPPIGGPTWLPRESSPLITDATYSCDSQSIYTCFEDGSVNVFTAGGLKLRCRINPTAYLPSTPSSRVYPLVITAHPTEPHQFALGLTDGGVHVLEPLETEGKWGTVPPQENGAGPSMSPIASGPDQSSR